MTHDIAVNYTAVGLEHQKEVNSTSFSEYVQILTEVSAIWCCTPFHVPPGVLTIYQSVVCSMGTNHNVITFVFTFHILLFSNGKSWWITIFSNSLSFTSIFPRTAMLIMVASEFCLSTTTMPRLFFQCLLTLPKYDKILWCTTVKVAQFLKSHDFCSIGNQARVFLRPVSYRSNGSSDLNTRHVAFFTLP